MTKSEFEKFWAGVRDGDRQTIEELVRRFEPLIRRIVRMRIRNSFLRRAFDSTDICQAVMASFFAQASKLNLKSEKHLEHLLVKMTMQTLIDNVRRELCRNRRSSSNVPEDWEPVARDSTPSSIIGRQEQAHAIREHLSEKEKWLVDQRAAGRNWIEIARALGDTPDALRMMHARAIARVKCQLQKEGSIHGR